MIKEMKKFTFLIYHKEYETFLQDIRELGVVHIEERQVGDIISPELQEALKESAAISSTEAFLSGYAGEKKQTLPAPESSLQRGKEVVAEVEELKQQLEAVNQKFPVLQKEIDTIEPWGDFDFAQLDRLRQAGYNLSFYICPNKDFNPDWEKDLDVVVIRRTGTSVYFVLVTPIDKPVELEIEAVRIGDTSLGDLRKRHEALTTEKEEIENRFRLLAQEESASLALYKREIANELEFSKAVLSGEKQAENTLYLLQGWVPQGEEAALIAYLDAQGIFYQADKPVREDNVPIQLNNSKFTKLFEPITKMFALPNYSELDPTPFFAPFFMLFFGLCMGDGGYGLIIFFVCWYLKKKVPENLKGFCTLGEILGLMTVLIGILTGSFFGIALDTVEWGWLKGVKSLFLTQGNYGKYIGGYNPMMIIAIVIGIIQILFGMCVAAAKATKQYGLRYAHSTLAWVAVIISGIVYLGLSALGVRLPQIVEYLFYGIFAVCAIFIYFFNSPGKGIFTNIGAGLWGTYNMATGLLGDTLSYIRLFALGLTGSILGGVFNTLAFDLTSSLPVLLQFVFAFIILMVGHAINFGLCMIGAFVHPLRLTFVEFYKNAGFEGGGTEYKPFKKQ